ncbi:MAG: hypothetical protein M3R15_08850 [Acidobacteriota bacterium]|nr:hypothetical protein [Acidobacteriota bacterium]
MQVTSSAFEEGQPIPAKYTCDGEDISPRLKWMGVPAEAVSLALIVEDPDGLRCKKYFGAGSSPSTFRYAAI